MAQEPIKSTPQATVVQPVAQDLNKKDPKSPNPGAPMTTLPSVSNPKAKQIQPKDYDDRNWVYIGNKPPMQYVTSIITLFNRGEKEVVIKSRGVNITKACTVIAIAKKTFMSGMKILNTDISTEEYELDGRQREVTSVKITISK